MGDDLNLNCQISSSLSMDDVQRKMILLEIEKNEKSSFDDVITGAESDNGWEDCMKETEEESAVSQWVTESSSISPTTLQENPHSDSPQSFYGLMDLNRNPTPAISRVPSQYQLDALSEMFIFDGPHHLAMRKAEDYPINNDSSIPYFVNSEYVFDMLS